MYIDIENMRSELNQKLTTGSSAAEVLPLCRELDKLISWYTDKNRTCCFTGHRLKRFAFASDKNHPDFLHLCRTIREQILAAVSDGYNHFLCGGGLGADHWITQELISLKEEAGLDITIELVLPCINQSTKWTKEQKQEYSYLCENADILTYVSKEEEHAGCHIQRNKFIIDRSARLIAVYYGGGGFAGQAVDYAVTSGLDVVYI